MHNRHSLQFNANNRLQHLLTIEGLSQALIERILRNADYFMNENRQPIKRDLLQGYSIFNLFFEPSTRTRTTFELAEKKLGANVINLNLSASATTKGETPLDTLYNLEAMGANMFVIRHSVSGAAHFFARQVSPGVAIINAGDGCHAHPTQALLDMATIRRYKGQISGLRVAIIGDILHSRVARSNIHALNIMEAEEVRVIGPRTLVPPEVRSLGVQVYHDLYKGLEGVDVIMGLRLQRERMENALFPSEREFYRRYGLTKEALSCAQDDAIVMHPGPVNRGIEMECSLIDSNRAVILQQVTEGIAVRMAVMQMIAQSEWEAPDL